MPTTSPARRVATFDDIEQAGDYCRNGANVWFLLPIHEGADKYDRPTRGSGIHGVQSPPWEFRECADGSLEIRASIACGRHDTDANGAGLGEYWHGWLDEGNVWRAA